MGGPSRSAKGGLGPKLTQHSQAGAEDRPGRHGSRTAPAAPHQTRVPPVSYCPDSTESFVLKDVCRRVRVPASHVTDDRVGRRLARGHTASWTSTSTGRRKHLPWPSVNQPLTPSYSNPERFLEKGTTQRDRGHSGLNRWADPSAAGLWDAAKELRCRMYSGGAECPRVHLARPLLGRTGLCPFKKFGVACT